MRFTSDEQRRAAFARMSRESRRYRALKTGAIVGLGTLAGLTLLRGARVHKFLFEFSRALERQNPVSYMQIVHKGRRLYPELGKGAVRFSRRSTGGTSITTGALKRKADLIAAIESAAVNFALKAPPKFRSLAYTLVKPFEGIHNKFITNTLEQYPSSISIHVFKPKVSTVVAIPRSPAFGTSLAHELGHASGRHISDASYSFAPSKLAEEMRANVKGYRIYRAAGGTRRAYLPFAAANQLSYIVGPNRQWAALAGTTAAALKYRKLTRQHKRRAA